MIPTTSFMHRYSLFFGLPGLPIWLVLCSLVRGGLYRMSFDLSNMARGELCRDRCMSLLLADPMQDTDAAKPNAGGGDVQDLDLRQGFGD
jgi:hypothetical protein